ncbi:MAG: rRNA maturation RNase YbeY [Opitutales bacterium]
MAKRELAITNRSEALLQPEEAARGLLRALEATGSFPIPDGELSIVFLGDSEIARIHENFMGDPAPTDVITFPGDPDMDFAGEILVSVDHAARHATEHGGSFSRELSLYLMHGWLHLAGYDDREEDDRARMRGAESEAIKKLESTGTLDGFQLHSFS